MATLKYKVNGSWKDINIALDNIYPIGSIYISYENQSPSSLLGGTWTQMGTEEAYMLRISDNNNIAGNDYHYHVETLGFDGALYINTAAALKEANTNYNGLSSVITMNSRGMLNISRANGAARLDYTGRNTDLPKHHNLYAWRRTA